MFFSAKSFLENKLGINEALVKEMYKDPAMHMKNPLFEGEVPNRPKLKRENMKLEWTKQQNAAYYVVYKKEKKSNKKIFCITSLCELNLEAAQSVGDYSVVAVNRGHSESSESNKIVIE